MADSCVLGTDLEAGSTLFGDSLAEAITRGLTNESTVDRALHRSLMQLVPLLLFVSLFVCPGGC